MRRVWSIRTYTSDIAPDDYAQDGAHDSLARAAREAMRDSLVVRAGGLGGLGARGHESLRVESPLSAARSASRTRSSTKARSTDRSRRRATTRYG